MCLQKTRKDHCLSVLKRRRVRLHRRCAHTVTMVSLNSLFARVSFSRRSFTMGQNTETKSPKGTEKKKIKKKKRNNQKIFPIRTPSVYASFGRFQIFRSAVFRLPMSSRAISRGVSLTRRVTKERLCMGKIMRPTTVTRVALTR